MKVRDLLSDSTKWVQSVTAKDADGRKLTSIESNMLKAANLPQACAWCLMGALYKCYNVDAEIFKGIIEHKVGRNIILYNDDMSRTFKEIQTLVRELDI